MKFELHLLRLDQNDRAIVSIAHLVQMAIFDWIKNTDCISDPYGSITLSLVSCVNDFLQPKVERFHVMFNITFNFKPFVSTKPLWVVFLKSLETGEIEDWYFSSDAISPSTPTKLFSNQIIGV